MAKTSRWNLVISRLNAFLDKYLPTLRRLYKFISYVTALGIALATIIAQSGLGQQDEPGTEPPSRPTGLIINYQLQSHPGRHYLVLVVENMTGRQCYPWFQFKVEPPPRSFEIRPGHLLQYASLDSFGLFNLDVPPKSAGIDIGGTITVHFESETPMVFDDPPNLKNNIKPRPSYDVRFDLTLHSEDEERSTPMYLAGLGSLTLSTVTLGLVVLVFIPVLLWISLTDPRKRIARYMKTIANWLRGTKKRRRRKTTRPTDG